MSLSRFIVLVYIITCTSSSPALYETVSAPPKFGDRIGKLKRNFQVTSTTKTTTTTATPSTTLSSFDNENEIHRSDDYYTTEDQDKKFFLLKGGDKEKESRMQDDNENQSQYEVAGPLGPYVPLVADNNSLNKTFQLQSPSSSLVQARLEMLTDFFDVPPSPMPSVYSTSARPSLLAKAGVVLAAKNYVQPTNTTFRSQMTSVETGLRREAWVIPVIVLSCLSMLMMAAFEIFVLCKTRKTSPNRRHLFLGQMLLLGLFSCAGLSALLTARPTTLSCATIRFGAGLSFAIVFSSLLVKCIFLISLNGGVYLPAPYQGLLLLFAVLIQITIGVQWLISAPPGVTFLKEISQTNRMIFTAENFNSMKESLQLCKTSFSEIRISLIYIDFLIIIVTWLAIKSRGIRDNYREATYIGLAVALVIPIWLGWTLVGLAVHERHKDACLAFGLLATPSIVFLVMFMPKGRQLAAMGREDIYLEERDERFSASSRAGSGYSPSFFHFKPIKYGVMSGKGTSGAVIDSNSKHQQAVTALEGGESVSLRHFSHSLVKSQKHKTHHNLVFIFQTIKLLFHLLITLHHCTTIRTIITIVHSQCFIIRITSIHRHIMQVTIDSLCQQLIGLLDFLFRSFHARRFKRVHNTRAHDEQQSKCLLSTITSSSWNDLLI